MRKNPKRPGPAPGYLGAVPSSKTKPQPKDPKVEAAHQEGFNLGYTEGAQVALKLINRILDGTEMSRLGDGEVRSVGPAYSQELFKEVEAKIKRLQEMVRLAIEKGRS